MIRRPKGVRRAAQCGIAMSLSAVLSGCGPGLESLPLAGPSAGEDTYSLTAEFSNALNLPARAKVRLDGADVGEVESIQARNFTAYVTMRIHSGVQFQVGSTVELRSATPLGDLFVAIRPAADPAPDGEILRNGDTFPIDSTTGGATVEEVLGSAALLVNGGVIKNATALLNGAGAAIGDRGDTLASLLRQSSDILARLNSRSTEIKSALQSTSELATALVARDDSFNTALSAAGPATKVLADNTSQLLDLTNGVARITGQLSRFPSLQDTDTRSIIADINHLSAVFNDIATDPNLSLTPINRLTPIVLKSLSTTAVHGTAEIAQLALGSLPDMNYPGDPLFHGPDGTDWHAMIGSLRYEWNLLLDKIYGGRQ